ncbi:MAG: Ig-like domain-containing protein, partial [Deltaproteobacteria bacterium]|nr:Ig-like domain-containing protein [Deltaproteobacteria bacterium]
MKRRLTRSAAWAALFSVAVTSCSGKGGGPIGPSGPLAGPGSASPLSDKALIQLKDAPNGLDMRVSDGAQGAPAADRKKIAPATKLSDADTGAILGRARPITTDPDDGKAFALRPGSQPAPRTGTTIKGAFPPAVSGVTPPVPASSETGKALRVLRYMPEGAVPIAPELSVTFSQPMVAVTSQGDAAGVQPVKLTPQPKGHWRWVGTKTVLFDPEIRFPMATTYSVEVPKGTKSATGGELADATRFTFETPPPTVVSSYPNGGPHHLDVPMFVLFDQKIDRRAVLAKLKVSAGGAAVAIEALDDAAIAAALADPKSHAYDVANLVERAKKNEQDGRWVAFRATAKLAQDTGFVVEIPAGTPSAEGPNVTKAAQSFAFRTYPPLKIRKDECGYQGKCPPGTPYVITFNNPLDADRFEEAQVTVSPDLPGLRVMQQYNSIVVQGATAAQTTYQVAVAAGVRDQFGQTLGSDASLSFHVTDAVPTFFGPSGMVVLDPGAKSPTLDFFTTNYDQLKVRLYKVEPGDFDAYNFYVRNQWNKDKPPPVPGTKVVDTLVATKAEKNKLVETSLDLLPALGKGNLGHAIAIVEPSPWTQRWEPPRMISWVQSTRLGLDAYVDADNLVAFASDLATGAPANGVALEIRPFGITGATDDKGVATLGLRTGAAKGAHYLVARRGNDVAFVAESVYGGDHGSWVKSARGSALAWYVIDDRKMYKPGEEVSLKGWLRAVDNGKGGDVGAAGVTALKYTVIDARGNEIGKGAAPVSVVGGFDTKFTLPKTPNLGYARVRFEATGRTSGQYEHGFQVQEFRRPEFEVSAKASQGPFLVGGGGDVAVSAKYFSGGPLPGAPVSWRFQASQTTFTPPNRDAYVFGAWTPWWGYSDGDDDEGGSYGYKPPRVWNLAAKTDATGAHVAHLDFLSVKPALPMSVTATANVTDVNRQQWSSSASLLVHPSNLYVGLRTKRPFVDKGVPFELDVIGVDLDGNAAVGAAIEVKAVRLDWEYKKGRYTQKEVSPQTCQVAAAKDPVACKLATPEGGTYKVTATIADAKGRPNQTSLTFWVAGGDRPAAREVKQERVQIIPDRKEYWAGNTAELMLQVPFYPAEALVSWRRSGMVKMERISITGPTKVITVPITDGMVPNLTVQVDLVGAAARTDDKGQPDARLPKRPAYAVGAIDLPVPPKQRTLQVEVTPAAAKLAPGESTRLQVVVKDAAGRPVPDAEAAVIVVDEAILSLTGYQFPDPVNVFYGHRYGDVRDYYSQAYVKLAKPELGRLAANTRGSTGDQFYADATTTPVGGAPPPAPPP